MLEQHVPTLETCKRMKELGWKQGYENMYVWDDGELYGELYVVTENYDVYHVTNSCIAAPLLSEIMEEIRINKVEFFFDITEHGEYEFEHYDRARSIADYQQYHKNPAEAAALLWIRLREEGIIK